jgi:Na+/melibiose symporter-like transporter
MSDNSIPDEKKLKMKRRIAWASLVLLTLAVLSVVMIPVWLIQPFRPQTPREMEVAYTLRRWSPLVTLIASIIALALVFWLWKGARRWWRKAALVVMLILTGATVWASRQNHFEWMFNPLPDASYARTSEAKFVDDNDRVMTVEVGNEAVAYPIRLMAYHHLVQDVVGGTPLVATY